MTYTLLPNSGQSLGQTRADIRTNFSLIQTAQDTNHVALGLASQGKHKFLQMPEQGSAPATAANEAGFYSKVGTLPAESNLFFRGESSGFEYQLTKADSAHTGTLGTFTNYAPVVANQYGGWTFLPGNMILMYGRMGGTSTSTAIVFPFDFPTTLFSVTYSIKVKTPNRLSTETTAGFTVSSDASLSSTFIYWQAIGN